MRTYFGVRDPYTRATSVMVQHREDFQHLRHAPRARAILHGRGDWQWGADGTGPPDLSRWLLADALRLDQVDDLALVEAFDARIIRVLPRDSWELCEAEVQAWVCLYLAAGPSCAACGGIEERTRRHACVCAWRTAWRAA
jgi:hypothetical protein